MEFGIVELHFPESRSASESGPAQPAARLAARGNTFTTVRGSGR
ncbi:hypothetical protein BN000_03362 [Mycobacterium europaeum]|uniref:Uncharacterized protein n=1 Tax=Mycobacterium europaeum TaxID=761804 RepID=A0A0U1DGS0_9MYCO|nr:hypothetical protein [Mycobacterium europaeum]CQD15990.1 hypothetical protein BN000_03362 [Mycobacterium europaeum]